MQGPPGFHMPGQPRYQGAMSAHREQAAELAKDSSSGCQSNTLPDLATSASGRKLQSHKARQGPCIVCPCGSSSAASRQTTRLSGGVGPIEAVAKGSFPRPRITSEERWTVRRPTRVMPTAWLYEISSCHTFPSPLAAVVWPARKGCTTHNQTGLVSRTSIFSVSEVKTTCPPAPTASNMNSPGSNGTLSL